MPSCTVVKMLRSVLRLTPGGSLLIARTCSSRAASFCGRLPMAELETKIDGFVRHHIPLRESTPANLVAMFLPAA